MTATVFVWDMFRGGVGHASMHVASSHGSIYISFWPMRHRPFDDAKIHFMNGDRMADGIPSWASKPINDVDEAAIIKWWSTIQRDPFINYRNKKLFQVSTNENTNFQRAEKQHYDIVFNQCATTVTTALLIGAAPPLRASMLGWLFVNAGRGLGPVQLPVQMPFRVPTITPKDVKNLVIHCWKDF